MKWLMFIPLLCSSYLFLISANFLPRIGDVQSPPSTHVSPRYIEFAEKETGTPNIVTAILADYRGYDTLGETSVIFIAGLACLLLLNKEVGK